MLTHFQPHFGLVVMKTIFFPSKFNRKHMFALDFCNTCYSLILILERVGLYHLFVYKYIRKMYKFKYSK